MPSAPCPQLLRADNFTPPQRTPWGGERITRTLKTWLSPQQVGESWEFSLAEAFPSRLLDGQRLDGVIDSDRHAWLGDDHGDGAVQPSGRFLVKLIDAADVLSLQVHPSDAQAASDGGRSGKSECWLVLAHEPGASLCLGFRQGVQREEVQRALQAGDDLRSGLCFVPVEVGDFFLIPAGTPHAIGGGILLLEAQQVQAGDEGITYRFWDWNRRYNAEGKQAANGQARQLHAAQALAVTDWQAPREQALLSQLRVRLGAANVQAPAQLRELTGMAGLGAFPLNVWCLEGAGEVSLQAWPMQRLLGLTVVAGEVRLVGDFGELRVEAGQSAALPAGIQLHHVALEACHAVLTVLAKVEGA